MTLAIEDLMHAAEEHAAPVPEDLDGCDPERVGWHSQSCGDAARCKKRQVAERAACISVLRISIALILLTWPSRIRSG